MTDVRAAKHRVLAAVGDAEWCNGVGIGLIGPKRETGIVVSLGEGAPGDAKDRILALVGDVPVEVRVVPHVRKLGV